METNVHAEGAVVEWVLPVDADGLLKLDDCDQLTEFLLAPPEAARIVVISAPKPGPFCLGRERTAVSIHEMPGEVNRLIRLNEALRQSPLITIAKIEGDAAGFGVGIAALADFSLASEGCNFWFPEVNINLAPTLVLAWLTALVGRRKALWLTATGNKFSASDAFEMGILSGIAADDEEQLDSRLGTMLDELLSRPSRIQREIKQFIGVCEQLNESQANEFARDRLVVGSLRRQG